MAIIKAQRHVTRSFKGKKGVIPVMNTENTLGIKGCHNKTQGKHGESAGLHRALGATRGKQPCLGKLPILYGFIDKNY
jgi:hypothetical protein